MAKGPGDKLLDTALDSFLGGSLFVTGVYLITSGATGFGLCALLAMAVCIVKVVFSFNRLSRFLSTLSEIIDAFALQVLGTEAAVNDVLNEITAQDPSERTIKEIVDSSVFSVKNKKK